MNPSSTLKIVLGGKNDQNRDPQVPSAVRYEISEGLRRLNDQTRPWNSRVIHGHRLLESLAKDARFADATQLIIPEVARSTLRNGIRDLDSLAPTLSPTDFELFPEDVRIGSAVLERLSRLESVFSSGGEVARGTVWLLGCANDNPKIQPLVTGMIVLTQKAPHRTA